MGNVKNAIVEEHQDVHPSPILDLSNSVHIDRSRVDITGIGVDNISEDEAVSRIEEWIDTGSTHYMVVVNASKLAAASRDVRLKTAILGADMVTADGMSVVWASRLLGRTLKQRVTGIDLFERLIGIAARNGVSVYFLGAETESIRGMVERLALERPGLRVAGFRDGYFKESEQVDVADTIKESSADLLFVALGSPKQEIWLATFVRSTGVKFALGVGGAFDHFSGRARRAPRWMQQVGFEWFYRLVREPRRLWRRYLIGNSRFVGLVVKQMMVRSQARHGSHANRTNTSEHPNADQETGKHSKTP